MTNYEEIVWYFYIKNWKIMWSDKTWKNTWLWKPFKITIPWYYRMEEWIPKLIVSEVDLLPTDIYIWNRDFEWYYQKRIEAVWWEKLEDTRVHNELKNNKEENNSKSEEQG